MTIFIKQVYETLIDVAQENGGKLQYRTNFILDEFANMPPLQDVDSMVSAARSRDIRFTFIIQNFAQLNDVYGEEVAQVIKGNCGNLVYLISTELKALEEISKMCGEVKSKDKDKTASTPLVTVSDLQKLKMGEAIIIRLRMNPFKTKYTPNFKMNWGEDFEEGTYPERQTEPIELFDLKKFVTEEKRKKMMSNAEAMSNNSAFMHREDQELRMPNREASTPINPFASGLGSMDIDSLMKDIDQKLKELDEEEKRQKEKLKEENKKITEDVPSRKEIEEFLNDDQEELLETDAKLDEIKETINEVDKDEKEVAKEEKKSTGKLSEKPKVNIDVDSVIVNENVITDDEFFDDFFGDDD